MKIQAGRFYFWMGCDEYSGVIQVQERGIEPSIKFLGDYDWKWASCDDGDMVLGINYSLRGACWKGDPIWWDNEASIQSRSLDEEVHVDHSWPTLELAQAGATYMERGWRLLVQAGSINHDYMRRNHFFGWGSSPEEGILYRCARSSEGKHYAMFQS